MRPLERFETWMQRVLEGGLTELLGGHVQPVDLARRLADHMEDNTLIGAGRTYAPNNYRVYLAPATGRSFATFQSALQDELAEYVSAVAEERGFHLVGRTSVVLLSDTNLRREQVRLDSDVVDPSVSGTDSHTQAMPVRTPPAAAVAEALRLVVGQRRFAVEAPGPVTLGRALDNDVIFDDPSVSRHHARIVSRGSHWMLEDLSSSSGCYVNSRHVSASMLRPGDLIRLGNVLARIESGLGSGTEATS